MKNTREAQQSTSFSEHCDFIIPIPFYKNIVFNKKVGLSFQLIYSFQAFVTKKPVIYIRHETTNNMFFHSSQYEFWFLSSRRKHFATLSIWIVSSGRPYFALSTVPSVPCVALCPMVYMYSFSCSGTSWCKNCYISGIFHSVSVSSMHGFALCITQKIRLMTTDV